MTHSQEREQKKLAYYAEPQNGALKRNVRHILGIFGGKDIAALFMGDPSVIPRRYSHNPQEISIIALLYTITCFPTP